jgi:hypothetical protein
MMALAGLDAQYQYWISMSFAVVIASYLAGDVTTRPIRWGIAILYLGVTLMFGMRFIEYGGNALTLINASIERGFPWTTAPISIWAVRAFVTSLSVVITVWFAVSGYKLKPRRERDSV